MLHHRCHNLLSMLAHSRIRSGWLRNIWIVFSLHLLWGYYVEVFLREYWLQKWRLLELGDLRLMRKESRLSWLDSLLELVLNLLLVLLVGKVLTKRLNCLASMFCIIIWHHTPISFTMIVILVSCIAGLVCYITLVEFSLLPTIRSNNHV